jgi:hypothetical protein
MIGVKNQSCSVLASDRGVGKDVPNGQTTMEPLSYSDSEGVKNDRATGIGAGIGADGGIRVGAVLQNLAKVAW